jgi:hypothetical protein
MSCPVSPSRLQILKVLLVPFAAPPKTKTGLPVLMSSRSALPAETSESTS